MFEDMFDDDAQDATNNSHAYVPPSDGQSITTHPQSQYMPKPSQLFGHQEEMWQLIDKFEKEAWSPRNVGIKTGWQAFDDAFDGGLKTGWIVLAGDSNIGKTSMLSLLAWNIAQSNQDVYVMDFSLDDPLMDKVPRVVAAANKVLINAVKTPNNFKQYPDMLKRRADGLKKIYQSVHQYRCYDADHSTDIDDIEDTIKNMIVNLEEEAIQLNQPRRKLVVLIDNFHDLTTTAREAQGGDKMKYDYLAQRVSDMATRYRIPIITTAEFKKINGFRRPVLDDIRETVKIKYEAKAILLCYNEVGIKGENAAVYFERHGVINKQPVFEVDFRKNKMSGYKGRLFFEFYPEIAYFELADKQTSKKYSNLIYSNE